MKKKYNAHTLTVILIMLGVILVTALSISLMTLKKMDDSLGLKKNSQTFAFHNADTGIKNVINSISDNSGKTFNDSFSCSDGKILGNGYSLELKDKYNNTIDCSSAIIKADDIISIKSTGFSADQNAGAIESALASTIPLVYEAGNDNNSCSLSSDNAWRDLCDLTLSFTTTKTSSAIQAFYKANTIGNNATLVTSMWIDGEEKKSSRALTGITVFWSNDGFWMGNVSAGNHTVVVKYRSDIGGTINAPSSSDWEARKLRIVVY